MSYEDIYSLVPDYEIEPGWWKLKWKPLWRKTFSIYISRGYRCTGFGARWYERGAHNGWGRSYNAYQFEFLLFTWTLNFWIKWNYCVMAEGPSDQSPLRPIIPKKQGVSTTEVIKTPFDLISKLSSTHDCEPLE